AKIMYAFVRFLEDDMCYALPVSDVKDFQPVHKRDFDDQKVPACQSTYPRPG
ncbi:hypothetical protein M9458_018632, partial [Cirrhinus mrigala]